MRQESAEALVQAGRMEKSGPIRVEEAEERTARPKDGRFGLR